MAAWVVSEEIGVYDSEAKKVIKLKLVEDSKHHYIYESPASKIRIVFSK